MPILFADDTNLICSSRNINFLVNEMMKCQKCPGWKPISFLWLSIKTKFRLFTSKCLSRKMGNILIDGRRISEVNETKFLGLIIDNNLQWSAHKQYISRNISKSIGVMVKARKVFEQNTLLTLHNSLILLYLIYCIHDWGKAYNTHLNHLIKIQNKAFRLIAGTSPHINTV